MPWLRLNDNLSIAYGIYLLYMASFYHLFISKMSDMLYSGTYMLKLKLPMSDRLHLLFLTRHHLLGARTAFLLHVLRASLCMHFSKTYQQLLLTLPPELRDSAIEYRKLKKLINQVVTELTSLGEYRDIF